MAEQKKGKSEGVGKQKDSLMGLPVLLCILKGITSEDAALSAADLTREMQQVTGEAYSVKTVGRHLEKLLEAKEKRDYASIVRYAFGGEVMATQAKSVRGRGSTAGNPQNRYYFRPCIDESSMKLISGSIISNMFLSCEEKDYLLAGMRMLNMQGEIYDPDADGTDFSKGIHEEGNDVAFPGDASVFLNHVGWLDYAIRGELQIEMTYGIYDLSDMGIDYHERMAQGQVRIYTLNPYALHWNGGHYYLLATYVKGYKPDYVKENGTPINFRVDRIVNVRLRKNQAPKGQRKKANAPVYAKREPVPFRLKEFLKEYPDSAPFFDGLRYGARFPAMRISEHSHLIDCQLECTAWSLQILVDTFGNVLEVKRSSKRHEAGEKDYNGRDQEFLEAVIKKVEFENIRDFCLMHPEYITPTGPPELVDAVRGKLEKALSRLDRKVTKGSEDS